MIPVRLTLIFSKSPQSASLSAKYGYDEWLVSRFVEYVPDVENFLSKMEMTPTRYIRVNTLKIPKANLVERLLLKGFELKTTVIPEVLAVTKAPFVTGASAEYLLGQ